MYEGGGGGGGGGWGGGGGAGGSGVCCVTGRMDGPSRASTVSADVDVPVYWAPTTAEML